VSEAIESIADIRTATHDDADSVVRMMVAFNLYESIDYSEERLAAVFAELVAHPEWGAVLMAEVGGVPAGYAVLAYGFDFEYGGRDIFLNELFVNERFRGRGVGKAILLAVETHARNGGAKASHLIVRQDNASAQVLYRRNNYQFDPRMLMSKTL
jgi:GNAT superfamily N-acetyltransferase